jgi:hypothetical protein
VARHSAIRKVERGHRKRRPYIHSLDDGDPKHFPSVKRDQNAESKKYKYLSDAHIIGGKSQDKKSDADESILDHPSSREDAPDSSSLSQVQVQDTLQTAPGAHRVISPVMVALDSSPGGTSTIPDSQGKDKDGDSVGSNPDYPTNTKEVPKPPLSQGQDVSPTEAPSAYCTIPLTIAAQELSPGGTFAVPNPQDKNTRSSDTGSSFGHPYLSTTAITIDPLRCETGPGFYRATPPMVVPKPSSSDSPDKSMTDQEERGAYGWGTIMSTFQAPFALCFPGQHGGREARIGEWGEGGGRGRENWKSEGGERRERSEEGIE